MANKRITYDIGFNVDNSQLNTLRQSLTSLEKDLGLTQLQIIKPQAVDKAKADLQEIKAAARIAGEAIEASFNPKLNTLNVQTFQNHLKQNNVTVQSLGSSFAKAGLQGEQAFRQMSVQLLNTGFQMKKTHNLLDSMAKTLGNTIKWSIASTAINTVTGKVQEAWNYTKKLDASLNDIRIVTDKSAESMEKFAKQANKAAKDLGASTTSYTKAALIYYQQGLNEKDVEARTQATIKAANVTGQSAAEVSEQLTAVWNGYKVASQEAELFVDKLAAVAATTAADLEELSTGMSKVASAASAMGVNIDQLSAQLSTIVSVTRQDASVVGTAMKTIFSRMGDLKVDGIDEFGVSLGDVSGQLKKMGINVLDQEGNLRDMGKVIEEVAAKWGTWTEAQRQAAAVAIAGKRQYNNLIALFENWDMYESALMTSQNSAGTLQKQQDTYMDSLEAHLQKLSTAGEKVYDAFFDSESMKDLIDGLTILVDKFASLTEAIGGGGNMLLLFGSTAMRVFSVQITNGIMGFVRNIQAAKFNVSQLEAQIELLSQLDNSKMPETEKHYQALLEMKKEELRYHKLISAEQRAQIDGMIETQNKNFTDNENQQAQLEKTKNYAKGLTGKEYKIIGTGAEHLEDKDIGQAYAEKEEAKRKREAAGFKTIRDAKVKASALGIDSNVMAKEVADANFANGRLKEISKEEKDIRTAVKKEEKARAVAQKLGVDTDQKAKHEATQYIAQRNRINNQLKANENNENFDRKGMLAQRDALDKQHEKAVAAYAAHKEARGKREELGVGTDEELKNKTQSLERESEQLQKTRLSKKEIQDRTDAISENKEERAKVKSLVDAEQKSDKSYNSKKEELEKDGNVEVVTAEEFLKILQKATDQSRDKEITVGKGAEAVESEEVYREEAQNISQQFAEQNAGMSIDAAVQNTANLTPEQLQMVTEYVALQEKAKAAHDEQIASVETLNTILTENGQILSETVQEELTDLNQKAKYQTVIGKVTKGVKLNAKEQKVLQEYLQQGHKILKKNTQQTEENTRAHQKNIDAARETANAEKMVADAYKQVQKEIKTQAMVKGIVDTIGAVGQLGSALQSIKNIGNIWNDESLSSGEKFLQILTAVSTAMMTAKFAIGGLTTGINALGLATSSKTAIGQVALAVSKKQTEEEKKALILSEAKQLGISMEGIETSKLTSKKLLGILATKLQQKATESGTKATWLQTAANWAMQASMWQITLIIMAIVAVAAIFIAIVKAVAKAQDNANVSMEEASEAADKAKEAYNDAKESYQNLMESFDKYDSAKKALEYMTVGTEEWKAAVEELNQQVIDLMTAYPALAKYVTSDEFGNLNISEEGQEEVLKAEKSKVAKAQQSMYAASIQLNTARSDKGKDALEDSLKDVSKEYNKKWGRGFGAALGAPGYWAARGFASIGDENKREKTVEAIQNELLKDPDNMAAMLADPEAFKKKVIENGDLKDNKETHAMLDALMENQEQLIANTQAIEANNKANDALAQQLAKSFLEENGGSDYNSATESEQRAMEKIIAGNSGEDSEVYKDKYDMMTTDLTRSRKKKREEAAKKYLEVMGIEGATSIEVDKDSGQISYKVDGKEYEVTKEQAAAAVASSRAMNAATGDGKLETISANLNKIQEKFGTEEENALMTAVSGETADFSNLTQSQLDALKENFSSEGLQKALGLTADELSEFAKSLGYESTDAYLKALEQGVTNYTTSNENLDLFKEGGVLSAMGGDMTLAAKQAVEKTYDSIAGFAGSGQYQDAFTEMAKTLNPAQLEKFSTIFSSVDWTSPLAMGEFTEQCKEAGITLTDEFVAAFDDASLSIGTMLTDLNKIKSLLKEFKDLAKDLEVGVSISDEDYQKLVSIMPEAENHFVNSIDGKMYIGGLDVNKAITETFDPTQNKEVIERAQSRVTSEWVGIEGQTANTLKTKAGWDAIFDAEGQYLDTSVEKNRDLLSLIGVSADTYNKADADTQRQYEEQIANILYDTDGTMRSVAEILEDQTEVWLSYGAWDLEQLKSYKDEGKVSQELYEKFYTIRGGEIAAQAGLDASAWTALTENKDFAGIQAAVESLQKIRLKDIDNDLKQIEADLNLLSARYEELEERQEDLYGDKAIEAIEELIELQDQLLAKEKERYTAALKQQGLEKSFLELNNDKLAEYGLSGIQFNSDGTVSDSYIDTLIAKAQENSSSEADFTYLKNIINQIYGYNDNLLKLEEDHVNSIKETYQKEYDLRLKSFETTIEIKLDLQEARAEWDDFINNYVQRGEHLSTVAMNKINSWNTSLSKYLEEGQDFTSREAWDTLFNDEHQYLADSAGNRELLKMINVSYEDYINSSADQQRAYEDAIADVIYGKDNKLETGGAAIFGEKSAAARISGLNKNIARGTLGLADNMSVVNSFYNEDGTVKDIKDIKDENGNPIFGKKVAYSDAEMAKINAWSTLGFGSMNSKANAQALFNDASYGWLQDDAGNRELLKRIGVDYDDYAALNREQQNEIEMKLVDELYNDDGTFKEYEYNQAEYQNKFNEALENAKDSYEELYELGQQLAEEYLNIQEEIKATYDAQLGRLENINGIYEGQIALSKLVGQNSQTAYSKLKENAADALAIAKAQAETFNAEYAKAFDASGKQLVTDEQLETLEANMAEAAQAVLDSTQAVIDTIVDEATENFKLKIDEAFEAVAGEGKNFSYLSTQWEMATMQDDMYLDDVNAEYGEYQLKRKFEKSIEETDNIYAQNKLLDAQIAMEQKLADIKEKQGKLRQYDLDRANAEYELTLKQIALEEAQQTANKMKLTRDAMGNYTYQYVADQDSIAQAEEELAAAENELYNIDKDAAKERAGEVFQYMEEGYEKVAELRKQGLYDEADLVWDTYFGTNGIVTGMKAEFDTIEANLTSLGHSFDGTSIGSVFDSLSAVDFEALGTTLGGLYSSSKEALTGEDGAVTQLTTLLNSNSPVVTALTNLESAYVKAGSSDVNGIAGLTSQTGALITSMDTLGGELDKWANDLSEKANKKLDNDAALNSNTSALGLLTQAIQAWSLLIDQDTTNDDSALSFLRALEIPTNDSTT